MKNRSILRWSFTHQNYSSTDTNLKYNRLFKNEKYIFLKSIQINIVIWLIDNEFEKQLRR